MDVKIEKKSETKRELVVTITKEEMENYLKVVAKKISLEKKIKGFRDGHAPLSAVENALGKKELYEEAAYEAVRQTYPKIIEENNLFAISSPEVELLKCAPQNEVIYKAVVYIMPEINLPDYKKIAEDTVKKETKEVKVEEKEVSTTIENIRESKAETKEVDKKAEEGDVVAFNFEGVFRQDSSKKIEEKEFQITLGKKEMEILDGFEENLLGMKKGEKKKFSINVKKLKNNEEDSKEVFGEADFEVEMLKVMKKELPEINDDFAKSIPNIKDLQDLKDKIKEGVKREKENALKEKVKIAVLKNIKKKTNFEVPEVMIEKELDNMIKTIENQIIQNGSSLDDYLQKINKKEEDLRKEWREKAEENVSYALILHAVSKAEKIDITREEIEEEVDRHFQIVNRKKEEEKEENLQRMRSYVGDVIKNRKVFQALSLEE